MPYPTKYSRLYDFASYQNANPTRPLPGDRVNFDLNAIKQSVTEIVDFLKGPIRSDGKLMNKTVGRDQLADNVNLGFDAPTDWAPATIYTLANTVFHGNIFYKANTNHTSGDTFDASKWDVIADFSAAVTAAAASADAAAASETSAAASETNATAAAVATAADLAAANAAAATATSAVSLFGTKVLASASTPVSALPFILTEGASVVGDGGGALYKNNTTSSGDLVITLADGVTDVGYDVAGPVINAAGCGLSPSATGAVNLAALKKAVSLCPIGGTVWVPPLSGVCTVDTSGGLSDAVLIDKTITLRIDGHLKASYAANEANPAYMFKITVDDVRFEGEGTLEGNGTLDVDHVDGSDAVYPGIIYVLNANNFRFKGVKILKHPKIGIHLVGSYRAVIGPCEMQGGPTSYEFSYIPPAYTEPNPNYIGSYYTGIAATGGGDHTFFRIHFTKDADGGRSVLGIFSSGDSGTAHGNKTLFCIADELWEKLLYGYGDRQVVVGNTQYGSAGNSHTDSFRIWGHNNVIFGNVTDGVRSPMQILDGRQNIVCNNEFKNCRSSGINVQDFSSTYSGGVSGNQIINNVITWDGVSTNAFGIQILGSDRAPLVGNIVSGNYISGLGRNGSFAIEVMGVSAQDAYKNVVRDNHLISFTDGIRLSRSLYGVVTNNDLYVGTGSGRGINLVGGTENEVAGNTGKDPGAWFLSIDASTIPSGTRFLNNRSVGATNIGIENLTFGSSNNYGQGNQWTAAPLVGTLTLSSSSATTTVTHGGVAPHASIFVQPTSSTAATKLAADGYYTAANPGDFNIANGNGNIGAGTETFRFEIIQ